MYEERTQGRVEPANPHPCSACPWRLENHGKPHPGGWFTKANRNRLWAQLRKGERMTCHPTDPTNPLPPGFDPLPEGVVTHECTGALILQQRELMRFQGIASVTPKGAIAAYRRSVAKAMTRDGLAEIVARAAGLNPFAARMPLPNLHQEVGHDGLTWPPETGLPFGLDGSEEVAS